MQANAQFWDGIAEKYAASPIRDQEAYEYTLERTRSYLKARDQVLELGCGTGSTSLLLADAVAGIEATDISKRMLAVGRRKAVEQGVRNVRFRQMELPDTTAEESFDVVMAFNLLHLVEDTEATLAQVYNQLKPGGLFISKTPCPQDKSSPLYIRAMLLALPVMQWVGRAPYVNFLSISHLEAAITWAGFEIVETGNYPVRPPSRYIVARKA